MIRTAGSYNLWCMPIRNLSSAASTSEGVAHVEQLISSTDSNTSTQFPRSYQLLAHTQKRCPSFLVGKKNLSSIHVLTVTNNVQKRPVLKLCLAESHKCRCKKNTRASEQQPSSQTFFDCDIRKYLDTKKPALFFESGLMRRSGVAAG